MSRNQMLIGAAGLLLGLLIGLLLGSGGPDLEEIDAAVAERLEAANQAQGERVAALETRIGELAARLDGIDAGVASGSEAVKGVTDRVAADLQALGSGLEELRSSLGGAIEQAGASHLAALERGIADLRAKLDALPALVPGATPPPAAETPAPAPAPAETTGDAEPPAGQAIGETTLLSDGDVRVFISKIDETAGTANIMVNGTMTTLAAGEAQSLRAGGEDCQVTLVSIDRGHAVIAGGCGADLPAPEGASPGNTVMFGDGAVRVFVSSVDENGARLAVNGFETRRVAVGEVIEVRVGEEDCRVTVQGIDRGHVALAYGCDS